MNADVGALARDIFLEASQPGPVREPVPVAKALARLQHEAEGDVPVDMEELEHALAEEFEFRFALMSQSRALRPQEREHWVVAVRWLIESLPAVDMEAQRAGKRVQVMLAALGALDVDRGGLTAIAKRFAGTHLVASMVAMLRTLGHVPGGLNARSEKWLQDLPQAVRAGNFKLLQQMRFPMRYRSDVWTSALLLWMLDPTELARLVCARDSILLSMLVCEVMGNEAPLFALQLENVTFKFISLAYVRRLQFAQPAVDVQGVLTSILRQVAQTPQWKGWLQALHERPERGSGESAALAQVLPELDEPQWRDFIFALELSTSRGSAEGVANILTHFAQKVDPEKAQRMWSLAFERWNAWDYGKGERHFHLSSPQVCAFDFPVAMHYAYMPAAERNALEQELHSAIVHVEQQWFANASELSSERNRLASMLRLVRHGSALGAGGEEALPPRVQPDSEYTEVRYGYYDVNETLARTMSR